MRLSRVYDDLGYPTDERIDTVSGESVYDRPMPVQRPPWECAVCGLESTAYPHWLDGHLMCKRCYRQSYGDAADAFSVRWASAIDPANYPDERPNYRDRRREER